VLVVGLGHERDASARVEGRVVDVARPERNAGDRHDAQALVLPAHRLTGRGIAEEKPALAALEPKSQPLADT
jgi:hypothetical protein